MTYIPLHKPVTEYNGLRLRHRRYRRVQTASYVTHGELHDDGQVDGVAIRRKLEGDRRVRLTTREVVCTVWEGNRAGLADKDIAELFGEPDNPGWVCSIRKRHKIPRVVKFREDELTRLIADTAERKKASPERLKAAGITWEKAA